MTTEKLEKVLTLIEDRITKIEANTKLSDDKKELIIAQFEALKDLINEKLNNTEEEIDLDELLK